MAQQNFKDICSICLGNFIQPKILICKHPFCQSCLQNYVNSTSKDGHFLCPLCRCDVILPGADVINLPSYSSAYRPLCDGVMTECNSLCEYRCPDCDQYFCRACRKAHDSIKIFKQHKVVSWNEPGPSQQIHGSISRQSNEERDLCSCQRGKSVEYLCSSCQIIICSKCCIENHTGHQIKDFQDEDFAREVREELGSLNHQLKHEIEKTGEFSLKVRTKEGEVNHLTKTICDQIDTQATNLHSEITRIAESLKNEVKKAYLEAEDSESPGTNGARIFQELAEDNNKVLESLKGSMKNSLMVLEERSVVQIWKQVLEQRRVLKGSACRDLLIPQVPVVSYERGELDDVSLRNLMGRVHVQGMFEGIYNLAELREKGKVSSKMEYKGLTWHIDVRRSGFEKVFISLQFSDESGNTTTVSDVDYYIKLVNFKVDTNSAIQQEVATFKSGRWVKQLIHPWKSLRDKRFGFLDSEDQFRVVVRLDF